MALDITDKDAVEKVITEVKPDAVIHCAAWTAVDMAEDDDKVAKVRAINAGGTQNIADVCKKLGCKMTYISTDYVFDGQGTEPWQPDCKDYKPLNVYGQTKLEGELAVSQTLEKYFIVRIAWVFGLNGKNFIKTMLNVGKTHDTVRVVNDQIGTPTYTYDLARLLVDMNETEKYGYYHATNEGGYISWYDFTKEIYRQAGYKTEVLPVTTAEYGLSKAARPFNSRLDKSKLVEAGFTPLPTWQDLMLIGALIQKYSKWINNAMVRYSCIIFVTLFIFDVFIDNVFLRLSVCVAFFIFVQNLKVKKVTDAQSHFLRRMSTVVFYAHMIIFFLWGLIDGKEPSYGFTGFIASLVGTVVLAVIISANRIKNSRLVRELFG